MHRNEIEAGHCLEKLAVNLCCAPDSAGRHVNFTWVGLGISNKLRNRTGRNRQINLHHRRGTVKARDRRDVAHKIKFEVVVKGRVEGVRDGRLEERISIGCCADYRLSSSVTARARSVFDDKWSSEAL